MAKKIKFPLEMKDGVMVRTLEELQENFDVEKLIGHWLNGKLQIWLSDRHYIEQLEQINAINNSENNIVNKLCNILNIQIESVEHYYKINDIASRQEKTKLLKQFTDNKEVLEDIDNIAFDQEEFEKLLEKDIKKIYLCGEKFILNNNIKNKIIVGINMPTVDIDVNLLVDFYESNVSFINIKFNKEYQNLIKQIEYNILHKKDKKRNPYKTSKLLDFRLSNEDREKCKMYYSTLEDGVLPMEYDVDGSTKCLAEILEKADISIYFSTDNLGKKQKDCLTESNINEIFYHFLDRI